MPTGVTVALGLNSWSAALTRTRFLPPREKSPTLTVALASIEMRNSGGIGCRIDPAELLEDGIDGRKLVLSLLLATLVG
jgi:hypothetical protein